MAGLRANSYLQAYPADQSAKHRSFKPKAKKEDVADLKAKIAIHESAKQHIKLLFSPTPSPKAYASFFIRLHECMKNTYTSREQKKEDA